MDEKAKKSVHLLLPEEVIEEEILSRLPVKSVLRFRCVSKSWRYLIDNERFIKTHLHNSTNDPTYAHWRVFDCRLEQWSMRSYLDDDDRRSAMDYPSNVNHAIMMSGRVVGSCNGVLCVLKEPERFFLWNPATRISIELPEMEHGLLNPQIYKLGFGWDEESGAYKVFVSLCDGSIERRRIGRVYSLKTNSWKTVNSGMQYVFSGIGRYACGRIYWLVNSVFDGRHIIEYLDLKTEAFGMIIPLQEEEKEIEEDKNADCVWVWEREGCVCVIRDDDGSLSVWAMKAKTETETETRTKTWVEVVEGDAKKIIPSVEVVKEPWTEVIFQPGKRLITCTCFEGVDRTRIITRACSCYHGEGFFCVQSLVSPLPPQNIH